MADGNDLRDLIRQSLEKREAARQAKSQAQPLLPEQATDPVSKPKQQGYRFLNPYNFVRSPEREAETSEGLVGRCAPPPHDRYVGISGRIRCELTTVTPLFIADSHGVDEEEVRGKKHLSLRFAQDANDAPYIPATSLRGTIRSVFEAVTNSCFSNFTSEKRLSYHLPPGEALQLVPARVIQDAAGNWQLELLEGTTPSRPGYRPNGPQHAAWVHLYAPVQGSRTVRQASGSDYARRKKVALGALGHGHACRALLEPMRHPRRNFQFWNVLSVDRPGATLTKTAPDQIIVDGYLCLTNQNIENKHDERLFFSQSKPRMLPLPRRVREHYGELLLDYWERHQKEINQRKRPDQVERGQTAFSSFILNLDAEAARRAPEKVLQPGDLVYAMVDQAGRGTAVRFVVPVSVPRVNYEHRIGDLLSENSLCKCHDYAELCPACRVFGWVWGSGDPGETPPQDESVPLAYAGRVRIGAAAWQPDRSSDDQAFDATMAILSSPKPTTTRFYLAPAHGRPHDGLDDGQVDYDHADQRLRGRKMYRHHGKKLSREEYQSQREQKSDQNRTLRNIQPPGRVFKFTVHFKNLAPVELGALLWTLEMDGWHHRLGMAKPLGFGSAQIAVTELFLLDPNQRYAGSTVAGGYAPSLDMKASLTNEFKAEMARYYGRAFEDLENVHDMKALLAADPELPVHYPRPSRQPLADGRNFEWFVGNKRSGRNAGPRATLPLAEDDTVGLPIVNRYGDLES